MLRYRIDILESLKKIGFTSYKIRKDKIIGEQQMQKIRTGELASKDTLNTICHLLNCQPGIFWSMYQMRKEKNSRLLRFMQECDIINM